MDLATRSLRMVELGPWLRLKRLVPARFHRLLEPVEGLLYKERGLSFRVAGHRVRVAPGSPAPVFSAYRPVPRENREDLELLATICDCLEPGDRFLDAGAHYGLYALAAAAKVGSTGRVIAFEPTPTTVTMLRRNTELSGFSSRLTVEQAAVSDREGKATFSAVGASCQNAFAAYGVFEGSTTAKAETFEVRTVALDAYFDPTMRTVVKIDIEGAELLALRGAPKLLASPARIFVELHAWAWDSKEAGWAELQALARGSGRTVRTLDGSPITTPSHERIELARVGQN